MKPDRENVQVNHLLRTLKCQPPRTIKRSLFRFTTLLSQMDGHFKQEIKVLEKLYCYFDALETGASTGELLKKLAPSNVKSMLFKISVGISLSDLNNSGEFATDIQMLDLIYDHFDYIEYGEFI